MSSTPGRWLTSAAVFLIGVAAITLTVLALQHVQRTPEVRASAPVASAAPTTHTAPSRAPSATSPAAPEDSNSAPPIDPAKERFLITSGSTLWRGVAGQCGTTEPLVERSADAGRTWVDVTPRYLAIGQLLGLAPFAAGEAEIVAMVGERCEVQALRTFTQGEFWESYPEALKTADYLDPNADESIVGVGGRAPAPCPDASGLKTTGTAAAVVCLGEAHVLRGAEWSALPERAVAAVGFDGDTVVVVHAAEGCDGAAISRTAQDGTNASLIECVDSATPPSSAAITIYDASVIFWWRDMVHRVPL